MMRDRCERNQLSLLFLPEGVQINYIISYR